MMPASNNSPNNCKAGTYLLSGPVAAQIYVEHGVDIVTLAKAATVQTPTTKAHRIEYDRAVFETAAVCALDPLSLMTS